MNTTGTHTNAFARPRIIRDLAGMLAHAFVAALATSATLTALVLVLQTAA